jgi:hypothetical protein
VPNSPTRRPWWRSSWCRRGGAPACPQPDQLQAHPSSRPTAPCRASSASAQPRIARVDSAGLPAAPDRALVEHRGGGPGHVRAGRRGQRQLPIARPRPDFAVDDLDPEHPAALDGEHTAAVVQPDLRVPVAGERVNRLAVAASGVQRLDPPSRMRNRPQSSGCRSGRTPGLTRRSIAAKTSPSHPQINGTAGPPPLTRSRRGIDLRRLDGYGQ